jgi:hypothetical protein
VEYLPVQNIICIVNGHGIENNCRQNNSDPGQKDTENQNRAERLLQEEKQENL